MIDNLANARLFTIGHSNHPIEKFLSLLRRFGIQAVADVRSSPFSRYNPQFNCEVIADSLREAGIAYYFLGQELGARRSESECYVNGKASYARIAKSYLFCQGLEQVRLNLTKSKVALLCAEKDPATCHRSILVCRNLRDITPIVHILENEQAESQAEMETRLLAICKLPQIDLFNTREELIEQAYDLQGNRIAYVATEEKEEKDW